MYVVFQCATLGASSSTVKAAWLSGTIPDPTQAGFENTVYGEITTSGITDAKAKLAINGIAQIRIDTSSYTRTRKIALAAIKNIPTVNPSRVIDEDSWDDTVRPAWVRAASATSNGLL